jgi:hypothetical protein
MKHIACLMGSLIFFLPALRMSGPVEAQYAQGPLIIAIGGQPEPYINADLWAWYRLGQPLKQLTHYGHNGLSSLSPDGNCVAY